MCLIVTSIFTYQETPKYQSSTRLFITTSPSSSDDAYQGALFSVQRVASYADLVSNSRALAQQVIQQVGANMSSSTLLNEVTTDVVADTVVLRITVTDSNAQLAQRLTTAYASSVTDLVRTLETPPGQTIPPIKATVVDAAVISISPVSPQPRRNLLLGLLLGLIIGVALAVIREFSDNTVRDPESLADILDAPLLGTVGFDASAAGSPLITDLDSHSTRVEAMRVVRTNLQFVKVDAVNKVFVVTSAVPEEGKTTTAVNLGITLSQAGNRTLLIEGDLRRPRAHTSLGLDRVPGLTTILIGKATLTDALQTHQLSNLDVLSSGAVPPNPAELLQSAAMVQLIEEAKQLYDIVLIDSPPLLPVADGALLAAQADGAIMIVRYGKTTVEQLAQARYRLDQVDANLAGAVLNMVPDRALGAGYGYGYGYGYAPREALESHSK